LTKLKFSAYNKLNEAVYAKRPYESKSCETSNDPTEKWGHLLFVALYATVLHL